MGFGTFGRTGPEGIRAILLALETGYRHLDTAQSYGTEIECGTALQRSGLRREEVFITTKIDMSNCRPGMLIPSLRRSIDNVASTYVDLTLIHWPVDPRGALDKAAYLPDLVEAQALGLTRMIGVSNFTIADLEASRPLLDGAKFATNQFERHPYLQNRKLVTYCETNDIAVTCYLPLARGACAGDPVIEAIAAAHNATPHQIALAFSLNQGHIVIPTSGQPDRIRENFAAAAIRLSPAEISAVAGLDRNGRQINPPWSPAWD
jgi:2,5-diketo-D-gluconate reductase B